MANLSDSGNIGKKMSKKLEEIGKACGGTFDEWSGDPIEDLCLATPDGS